jgi:hypothetical protein
MGLRGFGMVGLCEGVWDGDRSPERRPVYGIYREVETAWRNSVMRDESRRASK